MVTLLGRVGGEPQKRGTEEHPVVIFSLATHTNYKYDTGKVLYCTLCFVSCILCSVAFIYVCIQDP